MVDRLSAWLDAHADEEFSFTSRFSAEGRVELGTITGGELAQALRDRKPAIRLMALLHDITHAAFGHTLEDEVNVFDEKHDAPARQRRFFDALVAQLLYLWCTEERLHAFDANVLQGLARLELSGGEIEVTQWAEELAEFLSSPDRNHLAVMLRQLELAFRLLLHLDLMHGSGSALQCADQLVITQVAKIFDSTVAEFPFVHHRDMFMVDLVGNTICADLLDYARRDADNAGLKVQFDDRFLRYLGVASVTNDLSPTSHPCIRTAIQIFTDKMRQDVLSEMSGILKARYLINERVLFHPTKCAAGAMLGTAVQLLGLRDLPRWMQVLGDQQFLLSLNQIAENVEHFCAAVGSPGPLRQRPWPEVVAALWPSDPRMSSLITETIRWVAPDTQASGHLNDDQLGTVLKRARGARNLLWKLQSRRLPKLAYRLRTAHHTGGDTDETIARKYSTPFERYNLERRVEEMCRLPVGSVLIHCPKRKMSMKVAQVLVVGSDLHKAARLREVTKVSEEGLEPYQREIQAVEDMYRSIWQFHAYIDPTYWDKQPLVEWAFERILRFPNDELLSVELAQEPRGPYHHLVQDLEEEIAPRWLPAIVGRVDEQFASTRMRLGASEQISDTLKRIIREVTADVAKQDDAQLELPGINDGEVI
jgi:HD superfamily phosphohydrolase